jgi:hypothetical protein
MFVNKDSLRVVEYKESYSDKEYTRKGWFLDFSNYGDNTEGMETLVMIEDSETGEIVEKSPCCVKFIDREYPVRILIERKKE